MFNFNTKNTIEYQKIILINKKGMFKTGKDGHDIQLLGGNGNSSVFIYFSVIYFSISNIGIIGISTKGIGEGLKHSPLEIE
jgi:hypothetical protein